MTRSASMCCSTPSPPHAGQAPNGLLKENKRGSISEIENPETGQANLSEKIRRSGPLRSWIFAVFLCVCSPSPSIVGAGFQPALTRSEEHTSELQSRGP